MATTLPATSTFVEETTTEETLTFRDAVRALSREERFMGTVHAMNTLLVHKGFYTQKEFDSIFCRWATTQVSRERKERPGFRSMLGRLFR